MKIIKGILIALLVLIVVLGVVGIFLPSEYRVERSVVIDAPMETVFSNVNTVSKHELWSPWKDEDPSMKFTFNDIPAGEGASYSWTSDNMGEGSLTIIESIQNKGIKTDLDFGEMGAANGYYTFSKVDGGVKVVQGFTGDAGYNIPERYVNMFMDSMVGPMFEKGLAKLKVLSEL